ncbi:MAG TPA: hypothetical protein VIM37_03785 [Candidatus Microsaccharimonas sp.]|jgi:hypothetical protein
MTLNWRDYTALAAILLLILTLVSLLPGIPTAQSINWQAATFLLLLFAFAVYLAVGPDVVTLRDSLFEFTTWLGILAVIIAVPAIIINNELFFIFLSVDLLVLWSIMVFYHIRANGRSRVD